ncbi:MAG: DUF3108 domain-containing protein [Desulforhabdus sp.]|nr:DUF3108 domain-containing protein [Desulforhabdus sp.]
MKFIIALFSALIFFPVTCHGTALTKLQVDPPFQPGERLTFNLSWEFIPIGTAALEVLPMSSMQGKTVHHFLASVTTNPVIDNIYKVRDRIEGYADADLSRSVLYRMKQREGSCKRDITVIFDWEKGTAQYSNAEKKRPPIAISPGTFDLVSLFYAFRLQDLQEQTELQAPVTDGKKLVVGKAKILSKENVTVGNINYETFVVEPDIKEAGGVFEHGENAKLRVWITSDEKRIPVKVMCRAPIGRFIAELVSVEQH